MAEAEAAHSTIPARTTPKTGATAWATTPGATISRRGADAVTTHPGTYADDWILLGLRPSEDGDPDTDYADAATFE